jgi:uncharacterized membrane protein YqhA
MPNLRPKLEIGIEQLPFSSRWLLVPFYLGMVFALWLFSRANFLRSSPTCRV